MTQTTVLHLTLHLRPLKKYVNHVLQTVTGMNYTAPTGVATVTVPGHGLQNTGTFIQLADIQFECLSGGNVFNVLGMVYNKTVGLATITAIGLGALLKLESVLPLELEIYKFSILDLQDLLTNSSLQQVVQLLAGGTYSHQFITCASNGVTIVGGSTVTPTGATYDPSNGNFEITLTGHSLSTSDQIIIADNAFTFTCVMDGSVSQKTYPRPGKDNAGR